MTSLSRRFDRRVRRAVADLEAAGARVRVIDGDHALLYPPEGRKGPMLKVSASRPPRETLHFLRRQFAEPNGLHDDS